MSIEIKPNPATAGSVTGGLVYKGSYNAATNTPDLTTSTKGDFYIVSTGGTLAGVTLNVGDHIVFNQDAASPINSSMFDVIDNTDAVSTVNGLTGSVVLNLKTINDVNATLTPSDSTFLVGDGSEWIGESGATARTSLGLTIGTNVQAHDAQLDDIAGLTPTDSHIIIGDGSNFTTESGATARTSLGVAIGSDVQAHDAQLDDIAGLATTDGGFIVGDGSNFVIETLSTARTSLGLGSAATLDAGANTANQLVQLTAAAKLPAVDGSLLTNVTATDATKLAIANNLSDLNNAGTARGHLGVAIGSDVQAHNTKLDDIAGLAVTNGNIIVGDGSNFVAEAGATARTSLGLSIGSDVQAHNAKLDDIAGLATTDGGFIVGDGSNFVIETLSTARTSLGLGSAATLDAGANTANQLVQLTAAAKLPAVDGSLLTNLPSSGGFSYTAITSASSPVTSSTGVHYGADTSGGAITFNLPALSGLSGGEEIRIKLNTAGNNLTITPNGSDTVEGASTYVLSVAKEAVTCVASNGTNWEII